MGLRLEGTPCAPAGDPERLSTPVLPGAVQAAGGVPLVLGPACGTMGGYPHVAQVITADLPRLAQVRAGDRLRFEWVSLDEARRIDRDTRRELTRRLERIATMAGDRPSSADFVD
jgi:antagonist of KipI